MHFAGKEKTNVQPNVTDYFKETLVDIPKVCCEICHINFCSNIQLKKHLNIFHKEKCVKKIRRKKDEVVSSFVCHICNRCYTRKHDMQKHILLKHPDEKNNMELSARVRNAGILKKCKLGDIYKCDFCESKFQRTQLLLSHRRIHTKEKPNICHICGKQFNGLSATKRHIQQVHHRLKRIFCEICNMSFASNGKKEEHINTHTNFRPYMCTLCGKSFKQRASLYAHKMYHSHNYPFECRWCEKRFKRKSEVQLHEMRHTGEKKFACNVCMESFSAYRVLKKHSMIHVKYSCDECGLSFKHERRLKLHNKIHRSLK